MGASYNVDMGGDIAIHIVPQVTFGVQILGGQLLDADAFVRADMFAGLGINGSVSQAVAPQFCWNLCESWLYIDQITDVDGLCRLWCRGRRRSHRQVRHEHKPATHGRVLTGSQRAILGG